jgi:hypothetical protein
MKNSRNNPGNSQIKGAAKDDSMDG